MFYKLIEEKRNEWLASDDCTIKDLLKYIVQRGMMRDAQMEAIKTYLFLKIACQNKPLWKLFVDGIFNDTNIGQVELTDKAREIFKSNKAAVALFQYSRLKDKKGKQLAPELETYIKQHADEIDYEAIFKKIFYDVSYTDYLFSLPMGAGKTYLMAAFIYLDLYFAQNEPDNPSFAHNFMVMAPSGLKSSIVPSLKHIKEFDPSWIIPEPTATQLRRLIKFEILDEQKTANKSNQIKNPNAQKINNHQPLDDLMGLVAITNAEKVILDRFSADQDPNLFSEEELKRIELANELREIIGNLPNLAIYIDEVHHAADGEIKLRQVVNKWTENHTFNSVLGFSGTPYLESAERLSFSEEFSIRNTDLANVVYYYPLIEGIDNFLKNPDVKFTDNDTGTIVTNGVKEFLEKYGDLVYANGTCAKLAIYCGQIETLEEIIYPLVAEIVSTYGMNPTDVILKYHGGNKDYPQPEGSETAFASLDTTISKIKIILLVQIGKEGWDCKSLTGVILPQKGVCPTNMVLQTSCRCLRQVVKNSKETALIWLNKFNADKLNRQLEQQQNITLKEFSNKSSSGSKMIERFSRMEHMKVPPIDFYQLKGYLELLLKRYGADLWQMWTSEAPEDIFSEGVVYSLPGGKQQLAVMGTINPALARRFGIKQSVVAAEIDWNVLFSLVKRDKVSFREMPRFPEVRRDLALLLDETVKYADLRAAAFKNARKLLKQVNLFDVYRGDKIPEGKKQYALSFTLQDEERTLTDQDVERVIGRLMEVFTKDFGATLR